MQTKLAGFWISPVLGILSLNIFFAGAGNAATFQPKPNQKQPWRFDIDKYRWQHLIENFFAQMHKYRGIVTLYDQRACAFLGGIHWVATVIRPKLLTGPNCGTATKFVGDITTQALSSP